MKSCGLRVFDFESWACVKQVQIREAGGDRRPIGIVCSLGHSVGVRAFLRFFLAASCTSLIMSLTQVSASYQVASSSKFCSGLAANTLHIPLQNVTRKKKGNNVYPGAAIFGK